MLNCWIKANQKAAWETSWSLRGLQFWRVTDWPSGKGSLHIFSSVSFLGPFYDFLQATSLDFRRGKYSEPFPQIKYWSEDVWLAYAVGSGEDPELVHQDRPAPVTDGTNDRVLQLYWHLQCGEVGQLNCSVTTNYHLSEARYYLLISWCSNWHNTRGKPGGKTLKHFRVASVQSSLLPWIPRSGPRSLLWVG